MVLCAQSPRVVQKINDGWQFAKENNTDWQAVKLPHTWNIADVMDDEPGYYRGIGIYKRSLYIPAEMKGKQLFLFFEGANQITEVMVNGKSAGKHTGGYAAFYIPISNYVNVGTENEIVLKVDNSYNAAVPPLSADFTFFGGAYRDLYLVTTSAVHFSTNNYGSHSVQISTPLVNEKSATVSVKTKIANETKVAKRIIVAATIKNAAGKTVAATTAKISSNANSDQFITLPLIKVKEPELWSPDRPYLYDVITELKDASTGELLDVIKNPLGFRWFYFDAAKGFFLNGKPCKLIGTSRHQDYKNKGNALPDSLAVRDIELIKEMGGNFLRVAHYPQDPSVLEACDRLGILASVEIPVVNEITESEEFYKNCYAMQVEMIRQHYNHPSVIMWCYMNEVLLRMRYNDDKAKQKKYTAAITKLAKNLDSITRKEDPYRYTMIANHGDYTKYQQAGLTEIPMVVGWNLYSGWYGANLQDFPAFLDTFHAKHPGKPMLVSEYGADADPRIRSVDPVRFDKSIEYTVKFHQFYLKEMLARPFVAAAMVWNLADFNSETRNESMPHINNKGLLEWDRSPKDPYYYYKAMLSKEPFIKILGAEKIIAVPDSAGVTKRWPVQVAGNATEIELTVNDKKIGLAKVDNGIAEWNVALKEGENKLSVSCIINGKTYTDQQTVLLNWLATSFTTKKEELQPLNILVGAKRYFTDSENRLWAPAVKYGGNGWGYTGGKLFKAPGNGRLPYGTDKNIKGTEDDPVYQTQQIGIEQFRFDVPAGEYELVLHFAELLGGPVKDIPYNLSNDDRIEPNGKRVFSVYINGELLLDNFNIAEQAGTAVPVIKKINVKLAAGKPILVDFKAIEGEPVLNAIQLRRVEAGKQEQVNNYK